MAIRIQRVYSESNQPVARFLVDRAWPRGVPRDALSPDAWARDAAPSDELARWFEHDPARWEEFLRRYHAELDANPDGWSKVAAAADRGDVLLLFGARDESHNAAAALKRYLEARKRKLARGDRPSVRPPPSRRSAAR